MRVAPIGLRVANAYVREHHRHSKPTTGHKFSISLVNSRSDATVLGVAIVGRPVARRQDDGYTAEVLRLCVADPAPRNACSMLYGAARRAAKAMGYDRVITYTRIDEDGASLKASGFVATGRSPGKTWSVPSRPRDSEHHDLIERVRWEA